MRRASFCRKISSVGTPIRLASLFLLLFLLAGAPAPANAGFVQVGTIPYSPPPAWSPHGIGFDGAHWYVANAFNPYFVVYNPDFTSGTPITVQGMPGTGEMRGLTCDTNSAHLFVANFKSGIIYEVTTAGAVLANFATGSTSLNALAYDTDTDTIWLATYDGVLQRRTRTGSVLNTYNTAYNWTGLAFDRWNNTLLAMETGDAVLEYRTDGTLIGQVIPSGQIGSNGQGLAYLAPTGTLYATAQGPNVTLFRDSARAEPVPEPSASALMLLALPALLRPRTSRSSPPSRP